MGHDRKRYWQIKRKARTRSRSNKWDKTHNNRAHRARERALMNQLSHDDDWDMPCSHKRIEPWADWPDKCTAANYKGNNSCPKLTTAEARRLPGRIRHDWYYNLRERPWFSGYYGRYDARKRYTDFEYMVAWLVEHNHTWLYRGLMIEAGRGIHRKGYNSYWWRQGAPKWNEPRDTLLSLPAPTLIRQYLKDNPDVRKLLAAGAVTLGIWFYTTDPVLALPVEDREPSPEACPSGLRERS